MVPPFITEVNRTNLINKHRRGNKEVLIVDCVNELWNSAYMYGIDRALVEVKTGNEFRDEVAKRFLDDYSECIKLSDNLPSGYSFPHPPRLMQLYVAHKVKSTKGFLNLSGTGAGKTLSAVLASRVIDSRITLIICPKGVVGQWSDIIIGNKIEHIPAIYPNSHIINKKEDMKHIKRDESKYQYVILNYDKFSRDDIVKLIRRLTKEKIDFIILDELQFLKKREDVEASKRHDKVAALLTRVRRSNENLRVLGMTATPMI